jgi:hypothetical protein
LTEQEIFEWGDRAQSLIDSPDYIKLYEHITLEVAKEILATRPEEHERRKTLYNLYAGMREFGSRVVTMVAVKEQLIAQQNAEANQEDESN